MNNYLAAVLQSIRPMYCFGIAFGIKAPYSVPNSNKEYEVRKTKPKMPTPFKSYVYCTQHDGDNCVLAGVPRKWLVKVPFEYICDHIKVIQALPGRNKYDISPDDLKKTHLTQKQLWKYGKGKKLYLWHISDLVIYDEPKELDDFHYPPEKYCEKELCGGCPYDEIPNEYGEYEYDCEWKRPITRPPQSWCYVEELCD